MLCGNLQWGVASPQTKRLKHSVREESILVSRWAASSDSLQRFGRLVEMLVQMPRLSAPHLAKSRSVGSGRGVAVHPIGFAGTLGRATPAVCKVGGHQLKRVTIMVAACIHWSSCGLTSHQFLARRTAGYLEGPVLRPLPLRLLVVLGGLLERLLVAENIRFDHRAPSALVGRRLHQTGARAVRPSQPPPLARPFLSTRQAPLG
eukprot:GHVT01038186.1.p1 GENE.GHVT01038186.1~~GHVT01038186.1.p1  ORF type:complete len:204 (-),score=25.92 GHVT01038186.1:628-1239(-)